MKKSITLLFAMVALFAQAQFSTPGTGVTWTLDSLVQNSAGAVIWNTDHYEITTTILIAPQDAVNILEDVTVLFHDLAGIESGGTLIIDAPVKATFTAIDSLSTNRWRGFKLLTDHVTHIKNADLLFGGGIRAISGTFTIQGSKLYKTYYRSGSTTGSYASGAALDVSGHAVITNCTLTYNQRGAIASGSNVGTKAVIRNNYIFGNTTENSNRPQINMGPAGDGDTTYIVGNTVIGNGALQSGGIAYSSLLGVPGNVVIDSNIVDQNRYGITLTGSPINGVIRYNTITDNNIQNLPNLGGSGINLTASSASSNLVASLTGNIITGNLWGITIVGYPQVNMGNSDPDNFNPGGNQFSNNGNGGILYDLYNNGPVEQYAMYNCWGVATQDSTSIEGVVSHIVDDPALGRVNFMPACMYQTVFTAIDESGTPLAGVEISVEGIEGSFLTDDQGVVWSMLPPGEHNFTAILNGYANYIGTFTTTTGTTEVDFTMIPMSYQLSFYVYDENMSAVAEAEIIVNGELLYTGTEGTASIQLANGVYPFTVSKEGFYTYSDEALINDANTQVAVQLITTATPVYTLTFLVTDPEGTPLASAGIGITGQPDSLTTAPDGTASIELPDGSYTYTVSLQGYITGNGTIDISGANTNETVVLEPVAPALYIVTFSVDSEAGFLAGVEITLNDTVLITDEEGTAAIELQDGEYPYVASAEGYEPVNGTVTVAGADVEEVIFLGTGVEYALSASIKIYPNPVVNRLYIEGIPTGKAEIFTLGGNRLFSTEINSNSIDLSQLNAGTYLLRITFDEQSAVKVFVKQ